MLTKTDKLVFVDQVYSYTKMNTEYDAFLEYCHWLRWYKYYLMSFRAPATSNFS